MVLNSDGRTDVDRAADELAARLPGPLAPLARLAYNYAWSWFPGGNDLFAQIDPERWALTLRNPVRLLQEASGAALRRAAGDPALLAAARELEATVADYLETGPTGVHGIDPDRPVAFVCAEFGVHVSLPVYSGGLGALAGDIVKEASDLGLPMVAVGLMYRRGYFRQRVDAGGWQHEYWVDTDPERLPAALVTDREGAPLTITVPIANGEVTAQIWRVQVGRVPLLLLDTDVPDNDPVARWITGRLYEGDSDTRIAQYMLLGIGGMRALRAVGVEPGVVHLNEGHAALAPLELALGCPATNGASAARGERNANGSAAEREDIHELLQEARERTIFTTHTPVPAGNDSYPADQITKAFARLVQDSRIPSGELIALGQTDRADTAAPFGVTQTALRLTRAANAVSRRHGEVAREMWTGLFPGRAVEDVPITHVTNGVHLPTWLGDPMRELLDRHLGPGWPLAAADPAAWEPAARIPDDELWAVRSRQRAELIAFAARRSVRDRLERTDLPEYVTAAADALDPDVLTIGFARRVATYKRLDLLMRDPEGMLDLLAGDRPIQILLAGKAHPRDEEAKRSLQRLFGGKSARAVSERVVFLDDYDLFVGAVMTRGCDVWLNLPRPPLEASGTSGMKSAVNGGLQLSVLDGWWAEGHETGHGWAIPGDVDADHGAQDARDADTLHRLLAEEVVPTFYERDEHGLPVHWLDMVRGSLAKCAPQFSATRMVRDYIRGPYSSTRPVA